MKKKTIATVVLSIVAAIGLGVASYFIYDSFTAKSDGSITIEIIKLDGDKANEKEISFNNGDSLVALLEDNFENVVVKDGMLMSIDVLTTPEDWSTFICIYVDNEMSNVGILDIQFTDGTLISFVDTEVIY